MAYPAIERIGRNWTIVGGTIIFEIVFDIICWQPCVVTVDFKSSGSMTNFSGSGREFDSRRNTFRLETAKFRHCANLEAKGLVAPFSSPLQCTGAVFKPQLQILLHRPAAQFVICWQ